MINDLIDRVRNEHKFTVQGGDSLGSVGAFENKYGFSLPDDFREFYRLIASADFYDEALCIVPVSEILPATDAIFGINCESVELFLPESWFAFSTQGGSGDWIAIDLIQPEPGINPILDVYHEGPETSQVIALHFTEFLENALGLETDGLYWLTGEKEIYGEAHVQEAELSSKQMREAIELRIQEMEHEVGPENCKALSCNRLRIPLSVMCRRHHLFMLDRRFSEPLEEYEAKPARVTYERFISWRK